MLHGTWPANFGHAHADGAVRPAERLSKHTRSSGDVGPESYRAEFFPSQQYVFYRLTQNKLDTMSMQR